MTRRLLALLALGGVACGSGGATLDISLYTPAAEEQNPFEGVRQLRVTASAPGVEVPAQIFDVAAGSGRLTGLPLARFVRVVVEGLSGVDATPVSRGYGRPVDLVDGVGIKLPIFFARVDRFASNVAVATSNPSAMREQRAGHAVVLLKDGRLLVVGGAALSALGGVGAEPLSTAELFDPATGLSTLAGRMTFPRVFHTATLLKDGRVLVVGGLSLISMNLSPLATAELFDPASGRFQVLPPLREGRGRSGHSATLLPDGTVLLAGGWGEGESGRVALATAEIFDPARGSFADVGAMHAARANHTATLLLSGKVLVTGGRGAAGAVGSTALFVPASGGVGSFVVGPDLPGPGRAGHTAVRFGSGLVLVAGGCSAPEPPSASTAAASGSGCHGAQVATSILDRVDVYDPAGAETGRFLTGVAPNLGGARADHQAVLLSGDASVLLVGGLHGPDGAAVGEAEVFTEVGGGFVRRPTAAGLREARVFHAAARLASGLVMVSGGSRRSGAGASFSVSDGLEVYVP